VLCANSSSEHNSAWVVGYTEVIPTGYSELTELGLQLPDCRPSGSYRVVAQIETPSVASSTDNPLYGQVGK